MTPSPSTREPPKARTIAGSVRAATRARPSTTPHSEEGTNESSGRDTREERPRSAFHSRHARTRRERTLHPKKRNVPLPRRRYIVVFAEAQPLSPTCVVCRSVCCCRLAANCRVAVERHHYIGDSRTSDLASASSRLLRTAKRRGCLPCGCCYAVSRRCCRCFFSACATNVSLYSACRVASGSDTVGLVTCVAVEALAIHRAD